LRTGAIGGLQRDMSHLRSVLPVLAALAFLVPPLTASADDIEVGLIAKGLLGKSKPALVLKANKAVKRAHAELKGAGRTFHLSTDALKPGRSIDLPFDAPKGTNHFNGTLKVEFADGTGGEMPLNFDATVGGPPKIDVPYERLDLKASTLQLTMDADASKCEYSVLFDGKPDRNGVKEFSGEPAGTWLRVAWPPHGADDLVLRIALTCYDRDGYFTAIELFPWKLDIPHEDVTFATGKADIESGEAPKLDKALGDIDTAIRRYGRVVKVRLFVGGHTDTVGDNASNKALSLARARSIAAYFRKHGVTVPILYTGFGEDRLAVPTGDEVDERANRRAEYTIAVEEPIRTAWSSL
jgi:outer membrane protein OmpA-like peptidoglycan-associated protein